MSPSSPLPPSEREILVVDDDEGLLILMANALRDEGYQVTTAGSARKARESLDIRAPELMILDLKLQDAEGPELVARLQQDRSPVPFVIVTGQGDEKVAVEVMKQGALDYVMKDTGLVDLLPTVVKGAFAAIDQGKALRAAEAEHRRLEREILATGERERRSIGSDLHDGLGQQLTAVELMCAALKEDAANNPGMARRLDLMSRALRDAITQTRSLARGLVPVGNEPDALQIGLAALANQIDGLDRVNCRFECPAPVRIEDATVSAHLYRIAQEAVNNALKHAKAKNIRIRLTARLEVLELQVMDDGRGFAKSSRGREPGLGLNIMQHRARAIGAILTISDEPGQGTAVNCRLPIPS